MNGDAFEDRSLWSEKVRWCVQCRPSVLAGGSKGAKGDSESEA